MVVDGDAAVHSDGRDPVSLAPVRGYVQGACTLAVPFARGSVARQYCRVRALCRLFRLVGGYRGDDREDVAPRTGGPELPQGQIDCDAGRLRHLGLSDSTLDLAYRVRGLGGTIHCPIVHRRNCARSDVGRVVHGIHNTLGASQFGQDAADGHEDVTMGAPLPGAPIDPGIAAHRRRYRFYLSGCGDADRGSSDRCFGCGHSVALLRNVFVEQFRRQPIGGDPHNLHDRAHHCWCDVCDHRDGLHQDPTAPCRID